ncbi:hypothetical protein OUZ56_031173 [Daphnia magna]|uniref:Uncharacterized protein n=1 Tax=Daphnia magna TaxID=35525 RepID=A0ABQ9ZTH7_9CRUS|nr:hypothetical protein OUZ56_031173 [Daphnia magna]
MNTPHSPQRKTAKEKIKKGNSISRCIESTGVSPFTRTYDSIFFLTSFTCPIQIGYTLRYWARLEIAMGLRFLSVLRHRFSNVLSCGRTNDDLEQVARSLQDATGGWASSESEKNKNNGYNPFVALQYHEKSAREPNVMIYQTLNQFCAVAPISQ